MSSKWFVPGRIEVLGKHTDYAGGRSLLAAVERGFTITSEPRDDRQIHVMDTERRVTYETVLAPDLDGPHAGPGNYVLTVARRFARNFPHAQRGALITLRSTLPEASGMSSSSAMMIGLFLALADANNLESDPAAASIYRDRETLAAYLASVENGQTFERYAGDRGVGTAGGSEDHAAILCCAAGTLAQYAFCPVRHERTVALDPQLVFAVAVSGVRADKTGSARSLYNDAAGAVEQILDAWRKATGRDDRVLAHALASAPGAGARLRQLLVASGRAGLVERLDQFVEESDIIVPGATICLASGDLAGCGDLVDRSQALAERALRNQVPETIALARSARALGAPAASAFGAGFGGSVWAMVSARSAEAFLSEWAAHYRAAFPARAASSTFFLTRPGPSAHRIE